MSNNNVLKGVFLVGFVRPVMYASHFVKWPIMKDTPRQKLPLSVYIGNHRNILINLFQKTKKIKNTAIKASVKTFSSNAGTLGMTSVFYYLL
jgi:hypothetical protein